MVNLGRAVWVSKNRSGDALSLSDNGADSLKHELNLYADRSEKKEACAKRSMAEDAVLTDYQLPAGLSAFLVIADEIAGKDGYSCNPTFE